MEEQKVVIDINTSEKLGEVAKQLKKDAAQLDNIEALEKNWKFKEKMRKSYPEFVDSLNENDVESLERNLLIYAKHRSDTELAQKMDKELQEAKELARQLNAPYSEALKAIKAKIEYIHLVMKERKGEIDTID